MPDPKKPRWKKILREGASFAMFITASFAARSSLADHYVVPTGSMIPTVAIGDRVLVNKLAYGARVPFLDWYAVRGSDPRRGDVVVLASPENGVTLLKRVVAVPGDQVEVHEGRVFIAGELQDESSHALGMERGGGPDFGPITLGRDEFLVLGDHRGDSADGRYFGPVMRDAIKGRAEAVFRHEGRFAWRPLQR